MQTHHVFLHVVRLCTTDISGCCQLGVILLQVVVKSLNSPAELPMTSGDRVLESSTNIRGPKVQTEDANHCKNIDEVQQAWNGMEAQERVHLPSVHGSWTSPIGRSSLDPPTHVSYIVLVVHHLTEVLN